MTASPINHYWITQVSKVDKLHRRRFLRRSFEASGVAASYLLAAGGLVAGREAMRRSMQFGLCTYLWAQDWDLTTLLNNCSRSGIYGVELRTEHKHGVEPTLSHEDRRAVKMRFADTPVTLVGIGTNVCFDNPDRSIVNAMIDRAKAFLELSHDCGAEGVKVKPDSFHPHIAREKTIEQIGHSLRTLGIFAANLGQQVRLEVHGTCRSLAVIKQIVQVADHPNVRICWNCNSDTDLEGQGLRHNFELVKHLLGHTVHIHELDGRDYKYPYQQLFQLLDDSGYHGWVLLEGYENPTDAVTRLTEQRVLFEKMSRNDEVLETSPSGKPPGHLRGE